MKFIIGINVILFLILVKYFFDIYRSLRELKKKPELRQRIMTRSN
jgi:hypothetical protein